MPGMIRTRVIIPPYPDPSRVLAELEKAFRRQVNLIHSSYLLTVEKWDNPARFDKRINIRRDMMYGFVGTNDRRYLWIDEGTRLRRIVPKSTNRRGLLFFQPGYNAKTRPGQIASYPGGRYGPVVAAASVTHKIEAREFTKTIQEKMQKRFSKNITATMRRAAAREQARVASRRRMLRI